MIKKKARLVSMKFFITDLKRAFSERNFFITIFIGILSVFLPAVYLFLEGNLISFDFFKGSHGMILPFIAPILAAIPYSNMNMIEEKSGFDFLMFYRQGKKRWEFKRFFVNGITAGVAVSIPAGILAVFALFLGGTIQIYDMIEIVLLNFLFGFSFATVSYGLTFVNSKRYIPIVAPEVVYLLMIYSFPHLGLEQYYPPLAFSPYIFSSYANTKSSLMLMVLVIFIGILFIIYGKITRSFRVEKIIGGIKNA